MASAMDLLKSLILTIVTLILLGCATTQKYVETYGIGQTDIYRSCPYACIEFKKFPFATTREVENYLLYRSALVTIENAYDYFCIIDVYSEPNHFNFFNSINYSQYKYNPILYKSKFYKSSEFNPFRIKNYCGDCIGHINPRCPVRHVRLIIYMFDSPMPANFYPFNAADIAAHLGPTEAFY